ncbi:unnamed protein product [Thlaspi arvense]|uniref:Uncharacterized protein n=1 Tax=Thlaspi arvense TaxID=13288 RepID=A0AAU9T7Q5_THLAR|nr:unnamed protein product [Thlaspi arvense]
MKRDRVGKLGTDRQPPPEMEGVGARLGRSSTRYGPSSTVFNGPVRKWKKKWVQASPNTSSSNHHHSQTTYRNNGGIANGSNGSEILLYKWTPMGGSSDRSSTGDDDAAAGGPPEEPPRRKFKFVPNLSNCVGLVPFSLPGSLKMDYWGGENKDMQSNKIAVLEEQRDEVVENEAAEKSDHEAKPSDTDPNTVGLISKNDGLDDKPDINDMPVEGTRATDDTQLARQDLNISTLDLSLGLNPRDGDRNSDAKKDQSRDG